MASGIWKPGRRLFSVASILMLVMAVLHTIGFFGAKPDNADQLLIGMMGMRHEPMGMGMAPSMADIFYCLAASITVYSAAVGLLNLIVLASADAADSLVSKLLWVNIIWVTAFTALCFH